MSFTSIPIIIYAVFDQEHRINDLVLNKKNYYINGIQRKFYNFIKTVSLIIEYFGLGMLMGLGRLL